MVSYQLSTNSAANIFLNLKMEALLLVLLLMCNITSVSAVERMYHILPGYTIQDAEEVIQTCPYYTGRYGDICIMGCLSHDSLSHDSLSHDSLSHDSVHSASIHMENKTCKIHFKSPFSMNFVDDIIPDNDWSIYRYIWYSLFWAHNLYFFRNLINKLRCLFRHTKMLLLTKKNSLCSHH